MQVTTSKKHREIGQFFAPIVTLTLIATKRLKSYERNLQFTNISSRVLYLRKCICDRLEPSGFEVYSALSSIIIVLFRR